MRKLFEDTTGDEISGIENDKKPTTSKSPYWNAGVIFIFSLISNILVFIGAILIFSFMMGSLEGGYVAFIFGLADYGNVVLPLLSLVNIIFFIFSIKFGVDYIFRKNKVSPVDTNRIIFLFLIPYILFSIPNLLTFSLTSLVSLVELLFKAGCIWFFLNRKFKIVQTKAIT